MRRHTSRRNRVRDLLLYVVIAILVVAMIGVYAVHEAKPGGARSLPLKGLGFVGTSAIVFGYAIRACRPFWRMHKFWLLLTVFFIVHLSLGVLVLTRVATVA